VGCVRVGRGLGCGEVIAGRSRYGRCHLKRAAAGPGAPHGVDAGGVPHDERHHAHAVHVVWGVWGRGGQGGKEAGRVHAGGGVGQEAGGDRCRRRQRGAARARTSDALGLLHVAAHPARALGRLARGGAGGEMGSWGMVKGSRAPGPPRLCARSVAPAQARRGSGPAPRCPSPQPPHPAPTLSLVSSMRKSRADFGSGDAPPAAPLLPVALAPASAPPAADTGRLDMARCAGCAARGAWRPPPGGGRLAAARRQAAAAARMRRRGARGPAGWGPRIARPRGRRETRASSAMQWAGRGRGRGRGRARSTGVRAGGDGGERGRFIPFSIAMNVLSQSSPVENPPPTDTTTADLLRPGPCQRPQRPCGRL
jgi:hypothetical protein